ncbi:hypothetical protein [Burkholderia stagnalis]
MAALAAPARPSMMNARRTGLRAEVSRIDRVGGSEDGFVTLVVAGNEHPDD